MGLHSTNKVMAKRNKNINLIPAVPDKSTSAKKAAWMGMFIGNHYTYEEIDAAMSTSIIYQGPKGARAKR